MTSLRYLRDSPALSGEIPCGTVALVFAQALVFPDDHLARLFDGHRLLVAVVLVVKHHLLPRLTPTSTVNVVARNSFRGQLVAATPIVFPLETFTQRHVAVDVDGKPLLRGVRGPSIL